MILVARATLPGGRLWVNPPVVDWVMLLVIAAGIAWCWWARLHLCRLWSDNITRKQGHRIVDTGPYRLVRYPIYSGFILSYLGLAITCATALALVAIMAITLGLWLEARVEERFLIEELGALACGAYKAPRPDEGYRSPAGIAMVVDSLWVLVFSIS